MNKAYIYKITSPSNKIYIGQTRNLVKRKSNYRRLQTIKQPAIYNSIKKYGFDAHNFEIILELPLNIEQSIFDEYEIYYIKHYKDLGYKMLNILEGGKSSKLTNEIKLKISVANKGYKHTEEAKRKISEAHKKSGFKPPSAKGRILSQETKLKISLSNKGKITPKGIDNTTSRCIAQLKDDRVIYVFQSISEAIKLTNISESAITRYLSKQSINGMGYDWKYISKDDYLNLKNLNNEIHYVVKGYRLKKEKPVKIKKEYIMTEKRKEHLKNLSKKHKGVPKTEETLEKLKIGRDKYWANKERAKPKIPKRKKIALIDDENNIIQIFNTIRDAANILNLKEASICKVCKGERNSVYNKKFKYIENE